MNHRNVWLCQINRDDINDYHNNTAIISRSKGIHQDKWFNRDDIHFRNNDTQAEDNVDEAFLISYAPHIAC